VRKPGHIAHLIPEWLIAGRQRLQRKYLAPLMWPHGDSVGDAVPQQGIYRIFVHRIRLCYIPEQVIVRKVESVLNADDEKNNPEADRYFRERIPYALGILIKKISPWEDARCAVHLLRGCELTGRLRCFPC
jgi:hypothetical protein